MDEQTWKNLPQWTCWMQHLRGTGRKGKIPVDPHTGRYAKFNDPKTWRTYDYARRAGQWWNDKWMAENVPQWICGVTFVMTLDSGIVGIDLDDCFEEDGRLKEYAKEIVALMRTRTEYSPSGKGLHLFAVGVIPGKVHLPLRGFEMDNDKKGLTVTEKLLDGPTFGLPVLPTNLEERTEQMCVLHGIYAPPPRPVYRRVTFHDSNGTVSIDDVRNALSFLPSANLGYDQRIRVLMALQSTFPGEDGLALADAWLPGHRKDIERRWKGFRGEVHIGSLFQLAADNGYRHPLREMRR